jgi:hypothetical protein
MKRLERVIVGYLEVYDGPEEEARLKILETLKLLMQYTWPRYRIQTDKCAKRSTPQLIFSIKMYIESKHLGHAMHLNAFHFHTPIRF